MTKYYRKKKIKTYYWKENIYNSESKVFIKNRIMILNKKIKKKVNLEWPKNKIIVFDVIMNRVRFTRN